MSYKTGSSIVELNRGTAALDVMFPDASRMPYYIVAPAYTRFSAGIKVLHTLCHLLNLRGQSAFVVSAEVNPDLVTPILTHQIVESHFQAGRTPIIIYPERMTGNPLNASCVVRYLLNIPGLLGVEGGFGKEDILIWYCDHYRKACHGTEPILEIPTSDTRTFHPPTDGIEREGSCFYAGKFRIFSGEELSPITKDSVEIPFGGDGVTTQAQMAELFRKSEIFYAYEPTALGLEATLCGCPCVLVPSQFHRKPADRPALVWPGVVWGDDAEAIALAKATVHESLPKYVELAETTLRQLDDFVSLTQGAARAIPYREKIRLVDPHAPLPQVPPLPPKERLKNTAKAFLGRIR